MSISQSIKNIKRDFEFLRQEFSVISVQHDTVGMKIHFNSVDDFLKATKGFDIEKREYTEGLGEFEEYFAIVDGVRCFILVDEEEEKQLQEGLKNERIATKF